MRTLAGHDNPKPETGGQHGDGVDEAVNVVLLADRADVGEQMLGAARQVGSGDASGSAQPFSTTSESLWRRRSRTARFRYS